MALFGARISPLRAPGGRVITIERNVAGIKNHATPWEKQKIQNRFRRFYSVLADLDINFVIEGCLWYFTGFSISASGAKTQALHGYGKRG